MNNIISKIAELLLNLFIIIAAIVLCIVSIYAYQTKIQNKEYANIFGYSFFQIASGSMSPTMEKGDIIFVKLDENNLSENDIVIFKDNSDLVTHRIIKINEDTIITKGDANNSEDKEIKKDAVIGKNVITIKHISVIQNILHEPVVKILIIAIILVDIIFVVYNSKKIISGEDDEDGENEENEENEEDIKDDNLNNKEEIETEKTEEEKKNEKGENQEISN